MRPSSFKSLKTDLYMSFDGGDKWGSTMDLWFQIAAELHFRNPDIVPEHWDYRPSPSRDPREKDNCFYEILQEHKAKDLIRMGNIFERYSRLLKKYGHNY